MITKALGSSRTVLAASRPMPTRPHRLSHLRRNINPRLRVPSTYGTTLATSFAPSTRRLTSSCSAAKVMQSNPLFLRFGQLDTLRLSCR
eukprot:scaffold179822_cov31-Tisochrysis_lutea.AAC.3